MRVRVRSTRWRIRIRVSPLHVPSFPVARDRKIFGGFSEAPKNRFFVSTNRLLNLFCLIFNVYFKILIFSLTLFKDLTLRHRIAFKYQTNTTVEQASKRRI